MMVAKILDFIKGGFVKEITGAVDRFVFTKGEKAEHEIDKEKLKQEITKILHNQSMELQRFTLEAEKEFNDRIKALEGTATDLKQFGWIGKIVIFLRGLQRPLWGFAIMYMDYMVFSGAWELDATDKTKSSAFWIINFLVLGFLFGERAVKNVAPLVQNFMAKK